MSKYKIKLVNWPWQMKSGFWADVEGKAGQKWGWKLNTGGMGRFGGGWNWKLGVLVGDTEVIFELMYGSIRISNVTKQLLSKASSQSSDHTRCLMSEDWATMYINKFGLDDFLEDIR